MSDLFDKYADALSRPSGAYRALEAALGGVNKGIDAYKEAEDYKDQIRKRRFQQQKLSEALGGAVPPELAGLGDQTVESAKELAPFYAAASRFTERPARQPESLEAILAEKVRNGQMTMAQAAAAKRSMSPSIIEKSPPGFERVPGGLRPIPGGPAAHKLQIEQNKTQGALKNELDKSKFVIGKIDEALANAGPSTTGVVGTLTKNIPGTPSKNLLRTLDTVKANVGFETLQEMRNSSPTGGALGQISDRENTLLQSVRGSLDQDQSLDQFKKNLKDLRDHYSNVTLAIEGQTGDPEADNAIAQVIASQAPEAEKRARIQGIRAEALRGQ